MRDRVLFVVVGIVCTVAIGCSAKQLYPGSARPAEEVGIIKMMMNGGVTSISGRALEGRAFAVLPSTYPVEFDVIVPFSELFESAKGSNQRSTGRCAVTIEVNPGYVYQLTRQRPKVSLVNQRADGVRVEVDRPVFVVEIGPDEKVVKTQLADCEWPGMDIRQE